jgi:hypothetical protein
MYALIGAFLLYQFDANAWWWTAYGIMLLLNFLTAFIQGYRQRSNKNGL